MPSSIYFAFCFLSAYLHVAATQGNDLELSIPPQDTSCNKLSQIEEIPVTGQLTIRSKELIKHNPHSYFVFEVSQPGSPYMETCHIAFANCTHERGRQCYCFSLDKVNYDVVYVHKAGLNEQKTWVRLSWLSVTGKKLLDPQEGNVAHSYNIKEVPGMNGNITLNGGELDLSSECTFGQYLMDKNTFYACCPSKVSPCHVEITYGDQNVAREHCVMITDVSKEELKSYFKLEFFICNYYRKIFHCYEFPVMNLQGFVEDLTTDNTQSVLMFTMVGIIIICLVVAVTLYYKERIKVKQRSGG
ncbi:uncharacterized protein LOC131954317 [Physella acuta]|uniref:uncharacterized protein LOC131954317 n=1 Tax=Physella acuta TaxID=109671 RepID=UPI0027DC73D4|nr:uncharacterized protein LOC131954317 [Physella acuta]XP_059173893.1 uncharacterized protein LOC131954317 [Physella acuta]XP_059173894.1 uncharacterized protein LOC131954317 [Physella acuta]XP_059173895.1 uncharacterized protein LOC131954317 [Physella acuta]